MGGGEEKDFLDIQPLETYTQYAFLNIQIVFSARIERVQIYSFCKIERVKSAEDGFEKCYLRQ